MAKRLRQGDGVYYAVECIGGPHDGAMIEIRDGARFVHLLWRGLERLYV